jgi:hypothetical protein
MAVVACSIASGQALSAAADLGAFQLTAIITPPAWDNAPLTFQVSVDAGVTFYDFFVAGRFVETMMPILPAKLYNIALLTFPKNIQVKLRSGYPQLPINQSAIRAFSLITV